MEQSKTYTVQSGDSLYRIAQQQLGSVNEWRQIARMNDLRAPYRLQPGQIIHLP